MEIPKEDFLPPGARKRRREMTAQRRKLWYSFLKDYPVKFYRQCMIESFMVDFYCVKARLAVELDDAPDGGERDRAYDRDRLARLEGCGLKVMRFSSDDINVSFPLVCERIAREVNARLRRTRSPESGAK